MTTPGWAGHAARLAMPGLSLLLAAAVATATPIELLDRRAAGFVGLAQQGPLDQPVRVDSYAEFTTVFGASTAGLANPYLAPSVAAFFANGGGSVWVVRVADAGDASLIGVDGGAPGSRTGLQALRDPADIALVAIPGATSPAVQAALIAHCESAGNRLAILDPVSASDPDAVMAQRSGLATTDGYAALYFPWVVAAPAGVSLTLPPSGFAAGACARTAPPVSPSGAVAGVVATATGVSYAVNSTLQGALNPLGIDAIRYFAGQGVLLFGARTLASDAEWLYLPVRRVGFAIDASIRAGTAWCLSEANDTGLWTQLVSDVSDFMHSLWLAGWLQGVTPSQAYFVKCDATTMTAEDIAEGRTIVLVGFAPLTPAEFVILRIVQQRPSTAGVPPGAPALALRAPCPNPFGARTTVGFDLPSAAAVTLRIHDAAGRLVRTLADGSRLPAGRHERTWDGRDDGGASLAPGVYLVRLQAGAVVLARRVVFMR